MVVCEWWAAVSDQTFECKAEAHWNGRRYELQGEAEGPFLWARTKGLGN